MSTQRSPAHPKLADKDGSRLENYFSKTVSPTNVQAAKRQRPESASDVAEPSTDEMIRETLQIVKRMDTRVAAMDQKISSLEESVTFANLEIDDLKSENQKLKEVNAALIVRMDAMDERMNSLESALEHESKMRDALEANSRKINLELSGIPKSENETPADCKSHVGKVLTLMGSENGVECVDVAHRKRAGGIIIKFKTRDQRNEVFLKRFNLVGKTSLDLGFKLPSKGNPIYVNESLTFDRSSLMKDIRDRLKIINEGKSKDDRVKAKTSSGVIKVQDRSGDFVPISKFSQFNYLYPL